MTEICCGGQGPHGRYLVAVIHLGVGSDETETLFKVVQILEVKKTDI